MRGSATRRLRTSALREQLPQGLAAIILQSDGFREESTHSLASGVSQVAKFKVRRAERPDFGGVI